MQTRDRNGVRLAFNDSGSGSGAHETGDIPASYQLGWTCARIIRQE